MTTRLAISEAYRKNREDLRALVLGQYPPFFYRRSRGIAPNEIPVFAFHSVLPDRFESQMAYLAENGYRTIDANGLLEIVRGRRTASERTVAITFDDGRGSLWATAFPILQKYGIRAIAFIVPCRIRDASRPNPNLKDVLDGRCAQGSVLARDATEPFLTWSEVREMDRSGLIEFQSHSCWHHTVYVSERVVDFANPAIDGSFLRGSLHPVVRREGRDVVPERLEWGSPIYDWAPALASERRYLEDEDATRNLTRHVRENGADRFFERPGWRRMLHRVAEDAVRRRNGSEARYQRPEERYADMLEDLRRSKELIEDRVGKRVAHLCYPWFQGSEMAVQASKAAGYESNHWGVLKTGAVNRPGSDPFRVARMIDDYIFLLPGKGRSTLPAVLADRVRRITARRRGKSQ